MQDRILRRIDDREPIPGIIFALSHGQAQRSQKGEPSAAACFSVLA